MKNTGRPGYRTNGGYQTDGHSLDGNFGFGVRATSGLRVAHRAYLNPRDVPCWEVWVFRCRKIDLVVRAGEQQRRKHQPADGGAYGTRYVRQGRVGARGAAAHRDRREVRCGKNVRSLLKCSFFDRFQRIPRDARLGNQAQVPLEDVTEFVEEEPETCEVAQQLGILPAHSARRNAERGTRNADGNL